MHGARFELDRSFGRSSVASASVAQLELRMCGIQSSSFPPDLFVSSPVCSRVFFQVDSVLVFCQAVIFIPGNLAAWDESAWNRSRDGSMDATRWRKHSCRVYKIMSIGYFLWKFRSNDSAEDLFHTWSGHSCCEMMSGVADGSV